MVGRHGWGVVLAVGAVVVGAVLWNALTADRLGWEVEGDNGIVAVRAWDVLSAHPPLLGNPTTAGDGLHHPGPLESFVLAVPVHLLGGEGLLYGAALVNAACVVAIGALAGRRAGPRGALAGLGLAAALVWSLGSEIPHDAYNPHQAILPLAVLAVALWSTACRDRLGLPVAVVAASYAAQAHVFYALAALPLALAAGAAAATFARPPRRAVVVATVLGVVLWLPPLLRPGNGTGLLSTGDAEGPPIGFGFALGRLAATLVEGAWLERQPDPLRLVEEPAGRIQLLALLALGVLAWGGWRAHRGGRRTTAALVATALVTVAAATLATARLPGGYPLFQPYSHRVWWVAGALTWFAAAWVLVDELRARLPVAVVAIPAVVLAVAAAATVRVDHDRGSTSFAAIAALTGAALGAVDGDDGPWLVDGDGAQALLSVQPALVATLTLRGIDVVVPPAQAGAFGDHRVGAAPNELLVLSAAEPPEVPAGYELVARFDASDEVGDTSVFVEPQHLALVQRTDP